MVKELGQATVGAGNLRLISRACIIRTQHAGGEGSPAPPLPNCLFF